MSKWHVTGCHLLGLLEFGDHSKGKLAKHTMAPVKRTRGLFQREVYPLKKNWLIIVSVIILAALTACGGGSKASPAAASNSGQPSGSASAAPSKEPIKIGAIFSQSGPAGTLGKPGADALKMLVDQANETGGIDGHEVILLMYDDKSDQNEAVLSAKKLIEQSKVSAIIGGTISGNALAIIPLAEKAQIPYLATASSKHINIPVKKFVFKFTQGDDLAMVKIMDYLKKNNLKNVAWLNVDNSFGSSAVEEFKKLAPEAGVKAVVSDTFEATVRDAKPMLTRVKNAKPDAVIVWDTTQGAAVVTKNVREMGITVPIIESHGVANAEFVQLAGDGAEGVVFPADRMIAPEQVKDDNPQKKVLVEFKKLFEEKLHYTANTFGGHSWDAFSILKKAVETAGSTDPVKIRDAIESGTQQFVATGGIYTFSPTDHTGLKVDSLSMIQVKGKKWILLD
jgi:branched-chain amino acid transport system substrate-binding protein